MNERKTCKAIVISYSPYKEDSAMISLAGESGVFSCLAKGIYKPKSNLKPLLIIGNILELDYSILSSEVNVAHSLHVIFDASNLMMNLKSSTFLLFFQEICLSLFHYEDAFPFLEMSLILKMMSHHGDHLSLSLLFLGTLYKTLGLPLDVHSCIRCHKSQNIVSYSLKDGGFICQNCLKENEENVDKMELYILKFTFSELSDEILMKKVPEEKGLKIFMELYEYLLDYFDIKHLRSFPFLLKSLQDEL